MTEKVRLKWDAKIEVAKAVIIERYAKGETLIKYKVGKETTMSHIKAMEIAYGDWGTAVESLTPIKNYKEYVSKQKGLKIKEKNTKYLLDDIKKEVKEKASKKESLKLNQTKVKYLVKEYGSYDNALLDIIGMTVDEYLQNTIYVYDTLTVEEMEQRIRQYYNQFDKPLNTRVKSEKSFFNTFRKRLTPEIKEQFLTKYGTYEDAVKSILGFNFYKERDKVIRTKAHYRALYKLKAKILDRYNMGESVSKSAMGKGIKILDEHYGSYGYGIECICKIDSYEEYLKEIHINAVEKAKTLFTKWNKDALKDWLISAYNNGEDVRACALQNKYIFECIIREYGTYEALWVACGLDYIQYKIDTAIDTGMLSTGLGGLGWQFESLMDEILIEFGYEYTKYRLAEDTKLSPDNIFSNGTIGDSKLTYSRAVVRDVVSKYKKYGNDIEIYTLNSDKKIFTINVLDVDVRVYNIDYFVSMLPEHLQEQYQIKVNNLRAEYNKIYEDFREAV